MVNWLKKLKSVCYDACGEMCICTRCGHLKYIMSLVLIIDYYIFIIILELKLKARGCNLHW